MNSPNKSCGCSNQAKQALLLSIPIPPLIIYSILSLAPLPPTATTQQTTKITVPMVVVGNPGLTTQQAIQITVPIIVVILLLVVAIVITAVIIVYMKYRCVCVCVCLHVCVRACVCDVELLQPQSQQLIKDRRWERPGNDVGWFNSTVSDCICGRKDMLYVCHDSIHCVRLKLP